MRFEVKILEPDSQIEKTINRAILQQLNKKLPKIFKSLQSFIKIEVIAAIKSQKEYNSIISGELRAEFGLPDGNKRVARILETIESSLFVEYNKPSINGNKIKGGFSIGMIRNDFRDILSLNEAVLITENNTPLEWLKWLLLEGDKTIISGYEFSIGNSARSRTGGGIMSQSFSGTWRVPPAYSGQIDNNWITRAVDGVSKTIENRFIQLIKKM